ncbi:hypothetical protein ACGFXB_35290 [Streptomyces canus]|uniref:hypothetical protein n=1 Tax=Streptomyces canus TaxID=58343 RepID=UPI0037183540
MSVLDMMTLEAASAHYRMKMAAQAQEDSTNSGRSEEERVTVWKATWIPVIALGPADDTSGLCLDAATGFLGRWSRYDEAPGEERDAPGLIGGTSVWLSSSDPAREEEVAAPDGLTPFEGRWSAPTAVPFPSVPRRRARAGCRSSWLPWCLGSLRGLIPVVVLERATTFLFALGVGGCPDRLVTLQA